MVGATQLPMKRLLFLVTLCLLATAAPRASAADPFIAEFVPDNAGVATDEDGQYADLIEIQNPNATPFNLAGYYLTDTPLLLTKWVFPPVTLPGNGFLVVFASGKGRTADTNHLHTNFQLNKDGGYLALVKPDGSNIVNAFANYPAVKEDVAFGIAQKLTVTQPLIGTIPRVLVPTNVPGLPADWNQLSYMPDASWTNGIAPPAIGFDTNQTGGLPVNVAPSGTAVQSTTYNGTTYPANLALNGLLSDFTHTASTDNNAFWQVTLTNEMSIYEVVIFNRGGGCCQWRLRDITVEIVTTNLAGSVTNWISPLLNPENVLNGPGYLTNNLVTLTGGPVLGRTIIIHRKPDPDNSGAGTGTAADDQNVLSMGEVVITASLGSGLQPYFTTDIKNLMYQKNPSAFVRLPFVSTNTPDTLAMNVRYDDGFVAYLNGTEVARRNAPGSLAFDSVATVDRALTNATVQESIDLSASIPLLVNGPNLLAVQILNHSAANGDALFQPQLIATARVQTTNVFLDEVTLGALNDVIWYLDYVKDTHFSIDRGFFTNAFSLSITSGTPDALVYVSFNSDEPGPGKGFLYTNAFTITNTTVVRTRAFKANWKPSDVDTASYIFIADVINQSPNWVNTSSTPPPYFPATWGANSVNYGMDPQIVTNSTLAQWYEAFYQIGTMSIVTEMANLFDATTGIYANASQQGDAWERPASIELLDPTNAVQGRFQENAGLRIRGGASRGASFTKHSLRVFFRKDYGAGKLNYPLFENEGADNFNVFDLRTSQNYSWPRENTGGTTNLGGLNDTMVREVFCRKTLGDMGQPYRRSRYYHLFLNGHYWGLYETDEHPVASYGESYLGGQKENYDVVKNHDRYTSPPAAFSTEATDGNLIAFSNLWTMCRTHAAAPTLSNYFRILGCNPDGTRNPNLPVMIDVDNLIDYLLGIFYTGDGDATLSNFLANNRPNNWYGMRDRTNFNVGFRFFNNDCEHTLGAPSSQVDRTGPYRDASGSNIGNFLYANPQYLHEDLMWSPEYRQKFADHAQKHFFNGGALTLESCTNRYIAKLVQITKAARAYSARWGDAVAEPPYNVTNLIDRNTFVLTNWFPPRAGIVLQQLRVDLLFPSNSAPNFSQNGGATFSGAPIVLTQTNGSGVIYYTLDGTDPRAVGGGFAPGAQAYSVALTFAVPTVVRARVLSGGLWSGLVEYTFFPPQDLSRLLVTEIMYNPSGAVGIDGDEFEFVELKNAGTNTVNLTGLGFTAGLAYEFPVGTTIAPGQFHVLVRNPAQFAARYPGVGFHGVYTGKLDNDGGTVRLFHPLNGTVVSVTYAGAAPWPAAPDGFGFSLVPVNPGSNPDPNDALNWRASAVAGGSPGADDAVPAIPTVLINELASHSDLLGDYVELFNPNAFPVDIGGWFLTDDPGEPKKFRIPNGTNIAALGHIVFNEAQFNPLPGAPTSFQFNSHGDDVYLFSADAATTNLTGYSHGFSFGAAADGAAFGLYVTSQGAGHFVEQLSRTPGAANSGPRIGPVVFSEIMYHPADLAGGVDNSADEFVELLSLTNAPLPLHEGGTNAWHLRGGISFEFPAGTVLAANASLIVAAFDPANAAALAAFRAKYGVPAGVPVHGPFIGKLDNSADTVKLLRPDASDTNGSLSYILVEQVDYADDTPWPPSADGTGASLQRRVAGSYGNDVTNWLAATATGHGAWAGGVSPVISGQPTNTSVVAGQSASFTVVASGAGLRYQWRVGGTPVSGATNSTVLLTNLQLTQGGLYDVVVHNAAGAVISAAASLTVFVPATILQQPANQFFSVPPDPRATNAANRFAIFRVTASSLNPPLTYRWRMNGANLIPGSDTNFTGVTTDTLTISNVVLAHAGYYSCAITDARGTIASTEAVLGIKPYLVVPPGPQTIASGAPLHVSAILQAWPPPCLFQWRRGNISIGFETSSPSTTISTNFTSFNSGPTGFTNSLGSFSNAFNLRLYFSNLANLALEPMTNYPAFGPGINNVFVVADSDGDGVPNYIEAALNLETNNAADGLLDKDLDGLSNADEYRAGTEINNATNVLRISLTNVMGSAMLSFDAVSNRTYSLQFADAFSNAIPPAAWSRLADVPNWTNSRTLLIADPAWTTNRFYRVVIPRAP